MGGISWYIVAAVRKVAFPSKKGKGEERMIQNDSSDEDKDVRSMLSTRELESLSMAKTRDLFAT